MDEKYLQMLHPVTAILQWKIISILRNYCIKTVLDVGGVGKLEALSDYHVTDVNIAKGMGGAGIGVGILEGVDGCDLPFEDNSFDAVVSIATLEHVGDHEQFLQECERVAKKVTVHWFPCGVWAENAEELKRKYGHWHPCNIPTLYTGLEMFQESDTVRVRYGELEKFVTCGEHLLLCMTLTPSLKAPEVYDYVVKNYDRPYGTILIREK